MKQDITTFLLSALVFYMLHYLSPLVAGVVLLSFFLVDFKSVRSIFTTVKHIQKTMDISLSAVYPTIPLIFFWMAYAVVQLMGVFYIFESLSISNQWLKWIFPVVIVKSVYLIYQLGRNVPLKELNYTSPQDMRITLMLASVYSGVSFIAFYLEGLASHQPYETAVGIVTLVSLVIIACIASMIPLILYRKIFSMSRR